MKAEHLRMKMKPTVSDDGGPGLEARWVGVLLLGLLLQHQDHLTAASPFK